MIIRNILAELSGGNNTVAAIAKTIDGISEKPLRNALKEAGYQFSNQAPKGWHHIGEGEEPIDKSIFDYVKKSSRSITTGVISSSQQNESNVKRKPQEIHTNFTRESAATLEVDQQFSPAEISALKAMLSDWQSGKKSSSKIERLHDRIKELNASDKQRRTIVIDRKIGTELDNFTKRERVNKSDIIELAIMDFIEKYRD